jgi:hypothetical protein
MANVIRRGHVNNAGQPTTLTVVTSDATAAAVEEAAAAAVAPVQEQLDELTEAIADGTVAGAALQSLTVELPRGRRSGSTVVEPEGGFSDTQIGAPVMVTIAPNQGAIESVLFAGEVLNSRQMRLHWSAPGPAPSRVIVNYIIGSR